MVLLARAFVAEFNRRYDQDKRLCPAGLRALAANPWPGNIRELRSAVHRAHLLGAGDEVSLQPPSRRKPASHETADSIVFALGTTWAEMERATLLKVLAHCDNDKTAAARMLGISVRTVHNHLARIATASESAGAGGRPS